MCHGILEEPFSPQDVNDAWGYIGEELSSPNIASATQAAIQSFLFGPASPGIASHQNRTIPRIGMGDILYGAGRIVLAVTAAGLVLVN